MGSGRLQLEPRPISPLPPETKSGRWSLQISQANAMGEPGKLVTERTAPPHPAHVPARVPCGRRTRLVHPLSAATNRARLHSPSWRLHEERVFDTFAPALIGQPIASRTAVTIGSGRRGSGKIRSHPLYAKTSASTRPPARQGIPVGHTFALDNG
jgi:hypothetical protein